LSLAGNRRKGKEERGISHGQGKRERGKKKEEKKEKKEKKGRERNILTLASVRIFCDRIRAAICITI
jgi:hypothetical protein